MLARSGAGRVAASALPLAELAAACLVLAIAAHYSIVAKAAMVDPDIWWHIGVGDWIVANGTLPRVGVLSQHIERPWVAYSWGFDVVVSTIHRLYGLQGLIGFLIFFQVLMSLVFLIAVRHLAPITMVVADRSSVDLYVLSQSSPARVVHAALLYH